jgi:hypothetical protein
MPVLAKLLWKKKHASDLQEIAEVTELGLILAVIFGDTSLYKSVFLIRSTVI